MPTPEEKYYDSMNTLLAPVRWAKSLVQTFIIILLLIGVGLLYPIIQVVRDGHMTMGGFVVSFLTALFIFTFFYAPWYTVLGGILCFVVFYAFCFSQSFVDSLTGTGFSIFIFIFLAVGILQRYIRHRLFDAPREPRLSFIGQINQEHQELLAREYEDLSEEDRETMIRLHGENYFTWPRPWSLPTTGENHEPSQSVSWLDAEAEPCGELSECYATLSVRSDATPEEVKQAYRDLVMVWHPDRFTGGEARLKRKAEEQLKAINDAYERIQEHQRCQWQDSADDAAASPVNDFSGGGESQATRQSAAETTAREMAGHYPPTASAPDDGRVAMHESAPKVQTEEELIEAIDATRRRVDASTKKMEEFLEQMREQMQRR
jgi:DnaJ-domain-containing protein 1